ncbi:MAG TPA: rRNA maturation RNase YbeY [Mycobacteriales bacterium]|jgi:probable rRNA maturation factor|nr:rRNA maturation RNase YbeY [Mycobacteriales bacterium]
MSIEIANESGVDVDVHRVESVARFVLGEMGVNPLVELSIRLVDVEAMTALHVHFMKEPGPTDVLAFPMDELNDQRDDLESPDVPPTLLGDVVLCPAVAASQAKQAGHATEVELDLLCTHGVLHLLGYDHGDAAEEREMFGLQTQLLEGWTKREGRQAQ